MMALLLALLMIFGSNSIASAGSINISGGNGGNGVHVYTDAEYLALDNDVFALIANVEAQATANLTSVNGTSYYPTEADYIDMVPEVIEAIESSATYVEGTLQQNGNFLVWQTISGIPCCFDPRMEAELNTPSAPISDAEIMRIEADADAFASQISSVVSTMSTTSGRRSPSRRPVAFWKSIMPRSICVGS